MLHFVQRHADKVTGVLHGFDRLRFRGTLRNLMFIEGMSEFLWKSKVLLKDFKTYFTGVTRQVKAPSSRLRSRPAGLCIIRRRATPTRKRSHERSPQPITLRKD